MEIDYDKLLNEVHGTYYGSQDAFADKKHEFIDNNTCYDFI
tara:strand:- start:251 stop:373 length:123 start_codon:yes stop_codon:yes gene_type:complete